MNYLNALKTFVRLAEAGNFSRVARDFDIKPSTVSRHIADLEADLGIALFNRTTRNMTLTEGGRTFYKHVTGVLENLEEARESAIALNRAPRGVIRIAASPAFSSVFILPHLAQFRRENPEITIHLISSLTTPDLIAEQLDLAVVTGVLTDSSLMARKLMPHRYLACSIKVPEVLESIPEYRLDMAPGREWYITDGKGKMLGDCQIHPDGLLFNDEQAIMQACLANPELTGLVPGWLLQHSSCAETLHPVYPAHYFHPAQQEGFVWAVYPRKKTVSSKVRAFIDFLVAIVSG